MSDGIVFAGEYNIEYASILTPEGVELNVVKQITSLVVYEDIFSPFITGTLFLRDTFDLPNVFGRGGMNSLKLKISTPTISENKKINLSCTIYKHEDRVVVADRTQQYALHFISEESLQNQKRISAAFNGSPSDIAGKIAREHLRSKKPVISSFSTNTIRYVSNFWTATQNLQYIAEQSSGKFGESFLFYENRDGFNFSCISELASKTIKPIQEFSDFEYVAKANNPTIPQSVSRDLNLDYKSVLSVNMDVLYDYMNDYDSGMIKTKYYVADPVLKKLSIRNFDMTEDNKVPLNENRLYTDYVIRNSYPVIMSSTSQYNTFNTGDPKNLKRTQRRISQISQFKSSKLEIEVFGRTDYTVGKKVKLDSEQLRPFALGDSVEDYSDKTISGNYIISAVAHRFMPDKHICTLELVKDSTKLK